MRTEAVSYQFAWATVALLLLTAPSLRAQTTVLDEGAFRILIGGQEVGVEEFSIRRRGTGESAVVIAAGTVDLSSADTPERARSTLQLRGTSLRPDLYELLISGTQQQHIRGQIIGNRFSARIASNAGEQMREYLASDGAVLIDDGIAHHYFFLTQAARGSNTRIPVLIPRQSRQLSAEVVRSGRESIDVGGRSIEAEHLVVTPMGSPERHVWVDANGNVLRVRVPSQRYEAIRISPPR